MPKSIEYEKQMTELVYINLPGSSEPNSGMSGGELLHGFLPEVYKSPSTEIKAFVGSLCYSGMSTMLSITSSR